MKKFLTLIIGLLVAVNSQMLNVNCAQADDFEPAEEEQNSANTFVLDANDSGGDITLQFGTTLAEYLKWNSTDLRFDLSDDFYTEGNVIIGDGDETLTVNQDIIATGNLPEIAVVTTNPANDASIQMTISGQDEWQLGVDASDSFKFKIDNSNTTGSNTKLTLNGSGDMDLAGTSLTLDSDNTGSGANVSIIANQGSDNDGEIRYNATTNEWEYSNNGGSFTTIGSGGGGSTINIQEEGGNIPNTPHSTINFVGTSVTATDGGSGVATITVMGGGSGDLDNAYDNDVDKQMNVDNASGLTFDLTLGNLVFENSGSPFFTLYNNSNITYSAPDGGIFTLDGNTTRTSNTPLFNLISNFDTTTAGDNVFGTDVDVTRGADDTGQTFAQNIELYNNSLGEGYALRTYVNQDNTSSTGQSVGILADVSGNGDAGQYGSFMIANGSHTSTIENTTGVVGSGTSASANAAGMGGYFIGENTSTGYSVGILGQATDTTGANNISAGGAFLSMQEVDSTLSSSIVAMSLSETNSGIPTDFGLLIMDYVEAGFDEGFVTGIGIVPTTLTTGMQIQPPNGSTYTTGIDIDNSQGGTVTTGLQIDAGTNAILVESGNTIIDTDSTEAFLVRKNGDTGDVFAIDTTNSTANLYQNSLVVNLTADGTISAGDVVRPGTSALTVIRSTSTGNENVVGVAVTGGTVGQTIQVAVGGIFNVTVNNNVSIGNFLEPSNTAGRAQSSGTSGGTADFGIALTSGTAGSTVTGVFKKGEVY